MKLLKIAALLISTIWLISCASPQQEEINALKAELAEVKQLQALIARKVGMGALVRPDAIEMGDGVRIGNSNAKVAMIEFTDLHCPFCKKFHDEVYPELKQAYIDTDKLLFVGRELPLLNLHKNAGMAAVILRCANKQDKYVEVKKELFATGAAGLTLDYLKTIPETFSLDSESFQSCLKDTDVHNSVTLSAKYASEMGLGDTPVFILGRVAGDTVTDYKIIVGVKSVEEFGQIIDELAK